MLVVAWLNECVMPGGIWQWGRGSGELVSSHKTRTANRAPDQDAITQPDRRMDGDCEAMREECLGISMQNSGVFFASVFLGLGIPFFGSSQWPTLVPRAGSVLKIPRCADGEVRWWET